MPRDASKHLIDILKAAHDIAEFTLGMSFEDYRSNKLVKAAVERKFEIIGEAMQRLHGDAPEMVEQVREYSKIIAFRNLVIHGYDVVSDPIVWDVLQNKLPLLIEDVEKIQDSAK